jgi:tetratricopeptide (TPR) repeat protein
MRGIPRTAQLAFAVLVLLPSAALPEEWYDAYARGVHALAKHDAHKAIQNLEKAASLRPEPGANVITYGTNWIPDYSPYLALAEAYLLAGRPDEARVALQRSESFSKEPAERRTRLAAFVDAAMALPSPDAAVVLPPGATAPSPGGATWGWERNVEVLLLLARSHLVDAQAAIATAVERDRSLSPVMEPLAPRLAAALHDIEKTLETRKSSHGEAPRPEIHNPRMP